MVYIVMAYIGMADTALPPALPHCQQYLASDTTLPPGLPCPQHCLAASTTGPMLCADRVSNDDISAMITIYATMN